MGKSNDLTPEQLKQIQIFGTDKPCRLNRLWAWTRGPMRFLGNLNRKVKSWRYPRGLPMLRDIGRGSKRSSGNLTAHGTVDHKSGKGEMSSSLLDSERARVIEAEGNSLNGKVKIATRLEDDKDIVGMLLKDAGRSRVGGSEGLWDSVDEKTLEYVKKQTNLQRSAETKAMAAKKASSWDAHLDAGRVKKVKAQKQETSASTGSWDEAPNPFQAVQDSRLDGEGKFSMMSQKRTKVNKRSGATGYNSSVPRSKRNRLSNA